MALAHALVASSTPSSSSVRAMVASKEAYVDLWERREMGAPTSSPGSTLPIGSGRRCDGGGH